MVGFAGEGQPASACVAADCGPRGSHGGVALGRI